MLKNNILKIINTTFVNDLCLHRDFIKDIQKNKALSKKIYSQDVEFEDLYKEFNKSDFDIIKSKIEHYTQLSLKKIIFEIKYKKEILKISIFKKMNLEKGVISASTIIEIKNKNNLGSKFITKENKIELENYFSEKYILNKNLIKKNYSEINNKNISSFDLLIEKEAYNLLSLKTDVELSLNAINLHENILSLFIENKELNKMFRIEINDNDKIDKIKVLSNNIDKENDLLRGIDNFDNLDNVFKLLKINEFV